MKKQRIVEVERNRQKRSRIDMWKKKTSTNIRKCGVQQRGR